MPSSFTAKTSFVAAVVLTSLVSTAIAEDYRSGRAGAFCNPTCVDGRGPAQQAKVLRCGYDVLVVSQPKVGATWGEVDLDATVGSLTAVPDCKLPRAAEAPFKAELRRVRANFKGVKDDTIFVVQSRDWSYQRNALGAVVRRTFLVRSYNRQKPFPSLCGSADPDLKCGHRAGGAPGPHEHYVIALNNALLRLESGAEASRQGARPACEAAAWHAEREVRYAHARSATAKQWLASGIKLQVLATKALVEKPEQLDALVAKLGSAARKMYAQCGGRGAFHETGCVYLDNGQCLGPDTK